MIHYHDSQPIESSDRDDSQMPEFPEVSHDERLRLAQEAWKHSHGSKSRKYIHGVSRSTLRDRIKGATSKLETSQKMQRLSGFPPGEEEELADWISSLTSWGWPVKIEQVCAMTRELLQAKGDTKEFGVHWTEQFLRCHPTLKSKLVPGLDKDCVADEDPATLKAWFERVEYHIKANAVEEDVYNVDEKGIMMGVSNKVKVIISKYEKRQHMSDSGCREWVSLIECISAVGKALDPWLVFKGRAHTASWMKTLRSGHIALSDRGWTDNGLGLAWLKGCFHPGTLRYGDDGKQRF
jgi:sarcosine oxidase delta subunit